jgi:ice-binding like protein/putative Ig domain-containing protein
MRRRTLRTMAGSGCVGLAVLVFGAPAWAQTAPSLGAAQPYAVLAGSAVTNTGSSTVNGDLGVSPGTAVSGFPPGLVVAGTIHAADANALAAKNSLVTAYNSLASQPCTADLTGQDLGGLTLLAGVYCFSSSAQLTGTLTLNAQGNPNAVFIFKTGSTLTTASGASVSMIGGGSLCNVFWQIGSSATIGTSTSFAGNILALTSITLTTGATVTGRTLARNGAVTLDSNTVTATCITGGGTPPGGCPTITLSPTTLREATVAVAFSQTITATGGTGPYTFVIASGSLPTGLTLAASGVISGTPTASGPFSFTVRGTDANGCPGTVSYLMAVGAAPAPPGVCPAITLAPTTLPTGTVGAPYSQQITASGGTGPYVFGVTSGTIPSGLILSPAGLVSGTPLTGGSSAVTIRATDASGCFAEVVITIPITAPVPTLPEVFLFLLALLLAAAGYLHLRRRSVAQHHAQ